MLGPLMFLLYVNDIVTDTGSNIRLFADDTNFFIIVDNPGRCSFSKHRFRENSLWATTW